MNKNRRLVVLTFIVSSFIINACSVSKPQYYISGSGWNKIALVDSQGNQVWDHQLEDGQECNSVTHLNNGNLLYSFKQGAKLINSKHEKLWEYKCGEGSELHSASLTDEGNILVGICGQPAQIMEFSLDGEKLVDLSFETKIKHTHGQFRRVRKTAKGTYLVPLLKRRVICEINSKGEIIREVELDTPVFSLVILESGNWLLSCGDAHKLIEINPNTKEKIWELEENDIADVPLRFVAEALRLDNGNTIICNWGGHARGAKPVAQVIEIDSNKKLIWKIEDYQLFGNISTLDLVSKQKYKR